MLKDESVNESVYGSVGFTPSDKDAKPEHPNWRDLSAEEIQDYIDANPSTLWGRSLSIAKMVLRDKKRESINEPKDLEMSDEEEHEHVKNLLKRNFMDEELTSLTPNEIGDESKQDTSASGAYESKEFDFKKMVKEALKSKYLR